jgi:hypothetical protein
MKTWRPEIVEEWLQIAAKVDRIMPRPGPRMATPRIVSAPDWISLLWDKLSDDKPAPKFQPTNEQVSQYEEVVLRWFHLIPDPRDKKIVWMKSCGVSLRRMQKMLGIERHQISMRYKNAISALVKKLNSL